ncbi:1,2-dihydroxy-3-keto-5-methylthiopentene dioxygenase [Smittium culicis]|uniref:Acireductone dioxygenase n=1 Tax=Smittium culicis TaxID=133412 RepID=A0A1R1XIK3_9FUNG|nr:1,2-dihydroxy-3-keto-5-methylthiopentene dioxygenase [Smittium culicis]OMJ17139.1 1,2-dihydroxy-3-keto-5-methylthiopentene dioxygenase [Smittium culicis]
MRAYYYKEDDSDMCSPHDSGTPINEEELSRVGVVYYQIDVDSGMDRINDICAERNYKSRDIVRINREEMHELDAKLDVFFTEHFHEDEEIRLILDGCGYFDLRSSDDKWIRILVEKGDLLILPAGIYHRFTTTQDKRIVAMRLFKENPKWIAINRNENPVHNPFRNDYVSQYLS